jgi:hypothetical protein
LLQKVLRLYHAKVGLSQKQREPILKDAHNDKQLVGITNVDSHGSKTGDKRANIRNAGGVPKISKPRYPRTK